MVELCYQIIKLIFNWQRIDFYGTSLNTDKNNSMNCFKSILFLLYRAIALFSYKRNCFVDILQMSNCHVVLFGIDIFLKYIVIINGIGTKFEKWHVK